LAAAARAFGHVSSIAMTCPS